MFEYLHFPDNASASDGDINKSRKAKRGVSHYAPTQEDFIGLTNAEIQKLRRARPVCGLFAEVKIIEHTDIVSCEESCVLGKLTRYDHLSTTEGKIRLISRSLQCKNAELHSMGKSAFSMSNSYQIISKEKKRDDDDNCFVVGSSATSLFFCANSVDGRNIHEEAANAQLMWDPIVAPTQSPLTTTTVLLDCYIRATRNINVGEEIIVGTYGSGKADHYYNIFGFIPEPKGV
jgi:hypothetical protein